MPTGDDLLGKLCGIAAYGYIRGTHVSTLRLVAITRQS